MAKKGFKNFLGNPPSGLLKMKKSQIFQNWPHMTSYNIIFSLQNQLVLPKYGCLQEELQLKILKFDQMVYFLRKNELFVISFLNSISRPFSFIVTTSTQVKSWVWHENYFRPPPPHKLNVINISSVPAPILTKLWR